MCFSHPRQLITGGAGINVLKTRLKIHDGTSQICGERETEPAFCIDELLQNELHPKSGRKLKVGYTMKWNFNEVRLKWYF